MEATRSWSRRVYTTAGSAERGRDDAPRRNLDVQLDERERGTVPAQRVARRRILDRRQAVRNHLDHARYQLVARRENRSPIRSQNAHRPSQDSTSRPGGRRDSSTPPRRREERRSHRRGDGRRTAAIDGNTKGHPRFDVRTAAVGLAKRFRNRLVRNNPGGTTRGYPGNPPCGSPFWPRRAWLATCPVESRGRLDGGPRRATPLRGQFVVLDARTGKRVWHKGSCATTLG